MNIAERVEQSEFNNNQTELKSIKTEPNCKLINEAITYSHEEVVRTVDIISEGSKSESWFKTNLLFKACLKFF